MQKSGYVSVDAIIPAFNAVAYLEETIRSVAAQTLRPDHLIVVNDGSRDATLVLLKALQGQLGSAWLRIIDQDNAGLSAARNAGIRASTADYVALLDADDLWVPEKLAMQVALIQSSTEVPGLVYCDYTLIDEAGRFLPPEQCQDKISPTIRGRAWEALRDGNYIAGSGSAVMIRRALFDEVGYFDTAMRSTEDWDMWLRLAERTTFDFVEKPLVHIRRHAASMQTDPIKMLEGELVLFSKQYRSGRVSSVLYNHLRQVVATRHIDVRALSCAQHVAPDVLALFEGSRFRLWGLSYVWKLRVLRVMNLFKRLGKV